MTGYATAALSEELLALRNPEGLINPRDAVEWARKHPNSSLYQYLEWDDKTAAEEYRVQQVRRLIAVYIVDDNDNRRLVSLSIDRRNGGGYREIEEVIAQPDLREVMLNDALVDLRRLKAKYSNLKELVRVWVEADAIEQRQARGASRRPSNSRRGQASPPPA